MILAGDVGGTKTVLALYQIENTEWVCFKKEYYASADFETFSELLSDFLKGEEDLEVQSVSIGVAGPIVKGNCVTTNLPWVLRRQAIADQTDAKHVVLLNDLEATAWGVLGLPKDDFIELNKNAEEEKGNVAVLAAGTGLGEALIVWNGKDYHVVATEGGHTDFAPRNELEIGLLRFLMEMYPDHVSNERVVCGQGLIDIYKYLKSIEYASVNAAVELRMHTEDVASVISEKKCELSVKAVEMFCEIYGAESGNLALKCLPKAGVVLAGGIAAKNIGSMQGSDFMRGFLSKGRYKSALQSLSVKVCMNAEAALIGAFLVAKRKLQEGV